MRSVELIAPTFIEAPSELTEIVEEIRNGNSSRDIQARELIRKIAGLENIDGTYGNAHYQTVHSSGYPVVDARQVPDGVPDTARMHLDYAESRRQRPSAFFTPTGEKGTEFAVAACVEVRGGRILASPANTLLHLNTLSSKTPKCSLSLPLNWFDIAIGAEEGTEEEQERLNRSGIIVHEGSIVTAPANHVALADGRNALHRTPRYELNRVGEKRHFFSAKYAY